MTVTFLVVKMFVLVIVGVFEHDVPGVEKTREDTEHAKTDVDEGVCAADAAFNPD
jgi:hypothetical protein